MLRLDKLSRFHELRRDFPVFSYESYQYFISDKSVEITFSFDLSGKYEFHPKFSIPFKNGLFRNVTELDKSALDNLVFQIGMIELISYWKTTCSPHVIIKPHSLSAAEVKFWKKIYYHGLGEFFYMNSIEVYEDEFMELTFPGQIPLTRFSMGSSAGSLVPVGGGKDSSVTMGLLNKSGDDWLPFVINPRKATRDVIRAAGKSENNTIDFIRELDPILIKLNSQGFLNGHTPFSALLAFYSLLAAYLTGRHEILLSNESSANEPTVPGTTINHQYSKSIEFEKDFREYSRNFISPEFNYFSFLRPLTELQIAALFSGMPEYFQYFKSCNVGSKTDTWCGSCPKCLFTFIILSPFLNPETLVNIFGHNLLDDPGLIPVLEELSGISGIKPFECIGTVDEVNIALNRASKKYQNDNFPYLIDYYRQKGKMTNIAREDFRRLLKLLNQEHFLPGRYMEMLVNALR